jgi:hypothetical protein
MALLLESDDGIEVSCNLEFRVWNLEFVLYVRIPNSQFLIPNY